MPLFVCSVDTCDAIENTATGFYWPTVSEPPLERKPTCSECSSGHWHGAFEKQTATAEYLREHRQHFIWLPKRWLERLGER